MKRSAENWIAEIKLERQARRLARSAVASLVIDARAPRREIRIAEEAWLPKIWNALKKGFSSR